MALNEKKLVELAVELLNAKKYSHLKDCVVGGVRASDVAVVASEIAKSKDWVDFLRRIGAKVERRDLDPKRERAGIDGVYATSDFVPQEDVANHLPVVVRSYVWSGDLNLAINPAAFDYFAKTFAEFTAELSGEAKRRATFPF